MKFRDRVLRQTQKCDSVKLNANCNTDIYKPLRTCTYKLPHENIDTVYYDRKRFPWNSRSRRHHDHMVVGFTHTYAISAYHH